LVKRKKMIKFTKNPTRRILFLFPILGESSFSTTKDKKRWHKNQPFAFPLSKARGLLRVDAERRFSPRPQGWGLAPSKYQSLLHIGVRNPYHPFMD
jgi:hypothetical protein